MKYIPLLILVLLHLVAGLMNRKSNLFSSIIMIIGSMLGMVGIYLGYMTQDTKWWYLLVGSLGIVVSALYNGYLNRTINWHHHMIRILLFFLTYIPLLI